MIRRWVKRWLGIDRIEYWIMVHHPLIPTSATSDQVRERGYWQP